MYRFDVLFESASERDIFTGSVPQLLLSSLHERPQGSIEPKDGAVPLNSIVSLRLGGSESAYLSNRLGISNRTHGLK